MMLAPSDQPAASSTLSGYLRATWDTTALHAAWQCTGRVSACSCYSRSDQSRNAVACVLLQLFGKRAGAAKQGT
jgi:hypothetical protein